MNGVMEKGMRVARVVVVCMMAWILPVVAMGQPEWKDVVLKNGKRFGLSATAPTVQYYIMDPITGDKVMKTEELGKMPLTVDGEKVYTIREVKTDKRDSEVWNYLIDQIVLKLQDATLPDGKGWFYLHNIVLDKDGKIIYCDIEGYKFLDEKSGMMRSINADGYEGVLADAPKIVGKVDGKPVYFMMGTGEGKVKFAVRKGTISVVNN
jgi:hypothetical protein